MKSPKIKRDYAAEAAAREAQAAANNMQKNFAADLKTENIATVIPGGSAEEIEAPTTNRKRRTSGTTLASQLGINS